MRVTENPELAEYQLYLDTFRHKPELGPRLWSVLHRLEEPETAQAIYIEWLRSLILHIVRGGTNGNDLEIVETEQGVAMLRRGNHAPTVIAQYTKPAGVARYPSSGAMLGRGRSAMGRIIGQPRPAVTKPGEDARSRDTLDVALERAIATLTRNAQVALPASIRDDAVATAIDELMEQSHTPEEVADVIGRLTKGMVRTAVQARLGHPPSQSAFWQRVSARVLGVLGAVVLIVGILAGLAQLDMASLALPQVAAVVVLLVVAGGLGWAATGEVQRRWRQP